MSRNFETEPVSRLALPLGEFPQFVIKCASIYWDEVIAERTPMEDQFYFSPSGRSGPGSARDYAMQRFAETERRLKEALNFDDQTLADVTQNYNQQQLKTYLTKRSHSRQLLKMAYAWVPPTEKDEPFKEFMISRIDDPTKERVDEAIMAMRVDEAGYIDKLVERTEMCKSDLSDIENGHNDRRSFMKRISASLH